MIRLSRLGLLMLSLSACSATSPDRGFLGRVDATPTGTAAPRREGDGVAILALPQEARASGGFGERRYADGWRQSLALDRAEAAKGWNELTIDIRTDDAFPGDGAIAMGKPTQEGVRSELSTRFPATRMRVVARPMRNALGPFGLAIGAGEGGMRCAFAWQWVDDLRALGADASSRRGTPLPASVRLRLCRKGVTADTLASWFERLEFTGAANVERIAEAARGGVAPVVPGGDLVAPATTLESAIARDAPAEIRRPEARRRLVHRRRTAPAPARETASIPQDGAPRYLAPVSGASVHPRQSASIQGVGGASRLDPSLPPQAYNGPSAAR